MSCSKTPLRQNYKREWMTVLMNDGNDVLIEKNFHLDLEGDNIEDSECNDIPSPSIPARDTGHTLFILPVCIK